MGQNQSHFNNSPDYNSGNVLDDIISIFSSETNLAKIATTLKTKRDDDKYKLLLEYYQLYHKLIQHKQINNDIKNIIHYHRQCITDENDCPYQEWPIEIHGKLRVMSRNKYTVEVINTFIKKIEIDYEVEIVSQSNWEKFFLYIYYSSILPM